MGPTNLALVSLFRADQQLREAQGRLEGASRGVRIQERRINELTEKLKLAHSQLREQQAHNAELELEIKSRDAKIDRLRTQQQNSNNHKEYQAFLTEINIEKADKAKIEDESLKLLEVIEKAQAELKDLTSQLDVERKRHAETTSQLAGRLAELQAEVDRLKPLRDAAADGVPPKAIGTFERLADRFEGEAMAAISKPDRRTEEYLCNACNMSLVADVYNRLHSRDDIVLCPSCHRLLYIPEDLGVDQAINKPKERRERKPSARGDKVAAAAPRQSSAVDVLRSMQNEEEEPATDTPQPASADPPPAESSPEPEPHPAASAPPDAPTQP
jgi:predicted  nucleic acid-binding Zn-ribbon protein